MNAKIDRRTFVKTVGAAVVLGPSALEAASKPTKYKTCMIWGNRAALSCSDIEPDGSKWTPSNWFVSCPGCDDLHADAIKGSDKTGNGSIENPFKTWQHAVRVISM